MKKGIIFLLVLMFTFSWAFAKEGVIGQYDPSDYPAPTRQGGDTVADAMVIDALPYNDFGTTAGYIDDYDEVCPYTGATAPDVVYSYTPAADMINGFVSLCGDTDYDSKLYIYENAVTPGTPYACVDDVCTSALGQSYVSEITALTFTGGNTYYFVVDGYGANSGNYEIDVTADPVTTTLDPPLNLMVTEDGYATWEAPGGAQGGLILDQQPNQSNGIFSDSSYPQILADNFMLAGDAIIEQIITWGGYFSANIPMDPDYITVIIHADEAGSPGAELYYEADVASVRVQTGVVLFGVDEWMHTLTLATPVALTAGTYWIEYYHTTGYPATDTYFWEVGNADPVGGIIGSAYSLAFPVTTWALDAVNDFAMQVIASDESDNIAQKPIVTPTNYSTTTYAAPSHRISAVSNVPNITEPTRDLLGYNVYLDGVFVEFTTDLFYQYTGLVDGTTYLAEVTASYDDGESDPIEYTFMYGEPIPEDYIEIGDGTTYGANPSYYLDFANYWENVHTQTLYLASELGPATTFTELQWNFERIAAAPDNYLDNIVITLIPTSDAVLTTGAYYDTAAGTQVWGPEVGYVPATDVGWNTPIDIADFAYNGTDNLIVDIIFGDNGYWESPYYRTFRTDTGVDRVLYGYADGETPPDYDGSSTEISNIRFYYEGGATTFDPPTDVMVDDETGTISWFPPFMTIIDDNFDSYTSGDYIGVVGDDWTTWSNAPGGAEDAFVTDAQASSPDNSIVVELNQDLVLIMDDYTTGKYSFELKMFVPTGYCGYFNLQKTSTPGQEWAFQIYYQTDGMAYADMAAAAAYSHPFNHDEWMDIKVMVDLDNDWATYYFNGEEIGGYQWTLGTFGTPGLLQFGGVNIFGGANATQPTDVPMFYVDDVVLSEVSDEIAGFNLYLDGMLDGTVAEDVMEYTYADLVEDQTYTAGVSAVYTDGESDIVDVVFTYDPDTSFDPPANPTAAVVDYNDVELMWEAPSGAAEWIQWDSGEVGNGIGLTAPGTFYVASHWDPADLTDYDGAVISKIKFYPNDEAVFAVKVWTGANAATLESSEDVPTYTIGEFLEVELSNPVTIDASQELWFGYEIIQDLNGVFPAGGDLGPAIAGYGDMISLDGVGWDPLSGFGFDYNWNLAAYVEEADGSVLVINKHNRTKKVEARATTILNRNMFSSIPVEQVRDTRSLAGYKIYQDGVEVGEVADPATLTYLVESLDAGTYEFTITAFYTNPDGESVPTAGVNATVVLNPPSNGVANSNPPNIVVTWGAPARGVASYNVYRDGVLHEEGVTGTMFIDIAVPTGEYTYNLTAVYDGDWESELGPDFTVDHTSGDGILLPTVTKLTGNYPNPFNPTTTISFSLKEAGHVSVNIYNMRGQLVKTLVNAELERDFHKIVWDGRDNSGKTTTSGVYFYKMKAQNYNSTKKMILMK